MSGLTWAQAVYKGNHQITLAWNSALINMIFVAVKLIEKFTSGNSDIVIKAILMLRDTLPTPPCLKVLGMLLIAPDKEVEQCTSKQFLKLFYYLINQVILY